MMGCELAPSKDVLGVGTPTLNFMEQGSGAARVPVVQVGGETGKPLSWCIGRDNGLDDAVLLAPAIEKGEELMKQAGEDPEVTAS
jgi:hypothetical protein